MQTDPAGNVMSFMKLYQGADFGAQYAAAVAKKALDAVQSQAAQIIQMTNPNVGKNVDLKA